MDFELSGWGWRSERKRGEMDHEHVPGGIANIWYTAEEKAMPALKRVGRDYLAVVIKTK